MVYQQPRVTISSAIARVHTHSWLLLIPSFTACIGHEIWGLLEGSYQEKTKSIPRLPFNSYFVFRILPCHVNKSFNFSELVFLYFSNLWKSNLNHSINYIFVKDTPHNMQSFFFTNPHNIFNKEKKKKKFSQGHNKGWNASAFPHARHFHGELMSGSHVAMWPNWWNACSSAASALNTCASKELAQTYISTSWSACINQS